MSVLAGIEFEEMSLEEFNLGPVRRLRCKREDALPLCRALAGQIERPGTSIIESARPSEHPAYPGFFAREISKEVSATPDGIDEHAILTVAYSKPEFIPGF